MSDASRSQQEIGPCFDAYLPLDRRRALGTGGDVPERSSGTILFADVSGFTPLMEHLASTLGPQQGAEELTRLLNSLFAPLVGEVHRRGGSIVSFGGDALTCWFPGAAADAARRAAACALAMQRHTGDFGPTATPAGRATLSMHVGIAAGEVRRICVGRPPYGLQDLLAGATVERLARAQSRAAAGQVVVDAATAVFLPSEIQLPLGEGLFALAGAVMAEGVLPPSDSAGPLPALPARQARHWLAEPLYRRLQAGGGVFAAEFRLVTSLFVRFSGLDFEGDPSAGRKLQQYVAQAQQRLARYEGYLSLVSCDDEGGLLHVLFGAPLAHEDDPFRAVGFALEFQEAVRAFPFISAQRCGISSGRVYAGILGSPERCTYTVLGDEVNVSARLVGAAEVGQVLVSERVRRATADHYLYRPLGAVAVKGKEEAIPVHQPLAAWKREVVEEERLIGREWELAVLSELLAGVAAGRGQVLLVQGEAGVGKSALVRALLRQAQARGWSAHVGTCLRYGQRVPYLPWQALLGRICQLSPEMGPAEQMARLEQAVAALPDPPDRRDYWRTRFPLLAEAMGLVVADSPLTRSLEGELRRDNTFQLLEALVHRQVEQEPALLVLEDVYWADELSLALAAYLGRGLGSLRLLLVLVQRPPARPTPAVQAILALPRLTTLDLSALQEAPALELACQRLRVVTLPPALQRLLQDKAQGNPFFIEELLRALQEAGYLQRREGEVRLSGGWERLELPDTIEGVVRARLDLLAEEERLTLKVGAAIGRSFQRELLRQVHPGNPPDPLLARQLDLLEQAAFIQLEEGAPEWRYAFRHPILQEVTYTTLLFSQRRQLHGAIGTALERWHADDLLRVLDLLAYHYGRSEEREKAISYLQRAAEKARREYANEVALGHYSQALERLLPEERRLHYDLLAGRERIYNLLAEREPQGADLAEMAGLAQELGDRRRQVEVLNRQARQSADVGAFEAGLALAGRALELAVQCGDGLGEAEACSVQGILSASSGEYEAAWDALQKALSGYRGLGNREGELSCLGNLGTINLYRGAPGEALHYYEQALEAARRLADRRGEGRLLANLAATYLLRGSYDQARRYSEEALGILQEIGDLNSLEINLGNLGVVAMAQGDLEAAQPYLERALELAGSLEDPEGEATNLAQLGLLHAYRGEVEAARHSLRHSLRKSRQIGHRRAEAGARHALGITELWAGRPRTAVPMLRKALSLRREMGEPGNALAAQSWLGLALSETGEPLQARPLLEAALSQIAAEGYGGDYPEQEVWWAAYCVLAAAGESARARGCLEQAHRLVEAQAGRAQSASLRQAFLEGVPVNRMIERAWQKAAEET